METSAIHNAKAQKRTSLLKRNIGLTTICKMVSMGLNFLLVPLMISFVTIDGYGIWLLVTSFVGWATLMDFGMGNGLRNQLSKSLAQDDLVLAKTQVSTTYALLIAIASGMGLLFFAIAPFIDWVELLGIETSTNQLIIPLVLIVFGFFCLRFVANIFVAVLNAKQHSSAFDVINVISNALIVLSIFLVLKFSEGNLIRMAMIVGCIQVGTIFIGSVFFFRSKYKEISPSWKFVKWKQSRTIMQLGLNFFVIQIAGIVLFSTDNMIISKLFESSQISVYQIAFKYFSIVTIAFAIVCGPLWSAYTEAFENNDIDWIKSVNKKLIALWLLAFVGTGIMLLISPWVYSFWVGEEIKVPFNLSLWMAIYVALISWGSIFVTFINGVGKIRIQLIFSIVAAIVNIPLSIVLASHFDLGLMGIILATTICLSFGPFVAVFQYKKLINGTATGIWNK